jgi:nitroimidazol reductase NimA-like FMN-containing flavoprotein (pyridoxamine 5'-phosphate oxidase superfamily)
MKHQKYFIFPKWEMINNRKSLYSLENRICNMRKAIQEIMDKAVLEEILAGAEICRLSMLDGELPYIVPVNYGYQDGHIYIHSTPEGKKIDLLKKNKMVCFEVEDTVEIVKGEEACDWATRYRSVIGYATLEILSDDKSKQEGLKVIMAQHGAPKMVEFNEKNLRRMVILKLSITSLTGKQSSNWDHTF